MCRSQNNSYLVPNTKHISPGGLSWGRRRFHHPVRLKEFWEDNPPFLQKYIYQSTLQAAEVDIS